MTDEILFILEAGNVAAFHAANQILFPEAGAMAHDVSEIAMHLARTMAHRVDVRHRLYSHHWLIERGLPSHLPPHLLPIKVETKIVEAVGVAVMTHSDELKPAAKIIERAMADAVEDCYANGDTGLELIQARIEVARQEATRQMFGR